MKYLIFLILCLSMLACKQDDAPPVRQADYETSIPSDFLVFYDHFHTDSLFQINHIIFPLIGKQDGTPWLMESWKMHKPFNSMGGEFSRQFNNLNGIIIERMQDKTATVTIERRYSKMSGEYQLIYYTVSSTFGS